MLNNKQASKQTIWILPHSWLRFCHLAIVAVKVYSCKMDFANRLRTDIFSILIGLGEIYFGDTGELLQHTLSNRGTDKYCEEV